MIPRLLQKRVQACLLQAPILTILGPRQAGKTTLVKSTLPNFNYANLENPETRQWASSDPRGFLKAYPAPAIFDEVQRVPQLLSWIQTEVDISNRKGQYVLTGSNQPELGASISQSLAGRTSLLTLYPLSWEELHSAGKSLDRDEALFTGFLPRVHQDRQEPHQAYLDYLVTYVERDVRQILKIKDILKFELFLKLLAGRVGQLLNLQSLAGDVGVSSTTLAEWISVLEASFIVFRLPPYHSNLGKRLVKTPKIYFVEPGLLAALLQIESPKQIARDPLLGPLFENMVVVEILKGLSNRGRFDSLSFYRDSHGHEVDLILERQRRPLPVEIKASRTYSSEFQKGLQYFSSLVPDARRSWIVYGGQELRTLDESTLTGMDTLNQIFDEGT